MKRLAIIFTISLALAASATAQMSKPGPEHKKLEIFAGSWTIEGTVKPNSMGPGGPITENEKCDWMENNYFLVCRVEFKSESMGSGSGISVLGYSTDEKTYTYREFNSWGEFDDSRGTVNGDTWIWTNVEKMDSNPYQGRFTMKFTSTSAYTFTFETSKDGDNWSTVMEGKASKQ